MKHKLIILPISSVLLAGCSGLTGSLMDTTKDEFLSKLSSKISECEVLESFDDSYVLKMSSKNIMTEKVSFIDPSIKKKTIENNKSFESQKEVIKYSKESGILSLTDKETCSVKTNAGKEYSKNTEKTQYEINREDSVYYFDMTAKKYNKIECGSEDSASVLKNYASHHLSDFSSSFNSVAEAIESGDKYYMSKNVFTVTFKSEETEEQLTKTSPIRTVKKKGSIKIVFGKEKLSYEVNEEMTIEFEGKVTHNKSETSASLKKKNVKIRKAPRSNYLNLDIR